MKEIQRSTKNPNLFRDVFPKSLDPRNNFNQVGSTPVSWTLTSFQILVIVIPLDRRTDNPTNHHLIAIVVYTKNCDDKRLMMD